MVAGRTGGGSCATGSAVGSCFIRQHQANENQLIVIAQVATDLGA